MINIQSISMRLRKSLPLGTAIALICSSFSPVLATGFADFLFIVDESGSMYTEHGWLGSTVFQLEAALQGRGIGTGTQGNRYGLVGFGGASGTLGRSFSMNGNLFGNVSQFSTASQQLVTTGYLEDGYAGINFGFNNYTFREGAAVNVVLITDEDRDLVNGSLNFNSLLTTLQGRNALLNAVVDYGFRDRNGQSAIGVDGHGNAFVANGLGGFTTTTGGIATTGFGTTRQDYINLAWQTGNSTITGAAWNLNMLRAGGLQAQSFTSAFVHIKADEVSASISVPEPGATLALVTVAAFGIGTSRKQKAVNTKG